MVRFSCFQAHIHFHKPKKNVRLSGELMEKTSDDSSVNRNLGNVSCLPTEIKPCSKEDRDSPNTADHMTDSSPTERECISEEIESKRSIDCNFLAHNSIPIRKSQSLGSGLNWVERSSGADDSDGEKEHKLSSDESADRSAVLTPDEINNCGYQLQESVLSDSIRVNSDFAKDTSVFSIGDPQKSEGEHAHQDDLCLSDGFKSDDRTFHIHPIIVKSRSLPTMTSPYRCSTSFLQCSRSVEDLHGLECKTNNMLRELGRQVRYPEKDDSVVDNDKVHKENPADETSETYKYVQSAKDWIMPVLDVATEEKGFEGETSLYPPDELPPKDFRLKRIEDWVNDLQHYTPLDESGEYALFDDTEPSTGKFLLEDLTVMKSEVKVYPGTEAAKKYISSLNASAASAQLTNLGLVTIPILSAFVSLKALNLSGNAIVRITAGAFPRGLHTLNLSKNSISTIEGLRDLTRLRVLDLSYNRIVRIGHGLSSCSSLKELYLAGNKISEVEGLHRLLKLNILDLRFNKISTTKCLGQLAANYNCLQALSLEGNPSQKNVGEEQLRKYIISLLPHLTYYNRKPIKTGTIIKDSSDRSARLGIGTHQVDRGLELKKGKHGVVPSKVSSSSAASLIHGKRGHGTTSQKPSRSKHGPRLPIPSGSRMSGAQGHDQLAAADFGSKMLSLRNDLSIPRSQSDGNLRAF